MRRPRKKQLLQSVNYRIPPEVDEAIAALADREKANINPTVIRLLRFALAHIDCQSPGLPTFGECRAESG
jgi:predicted HicB family RNase H-like nuclease